MNEKDLRDIITQVLSEMNQTPAAAATAPAATLMVVKQYKAEGPLTKLLLLVVALDDAVGLMLFSVSFGIARALESGVVAILVIILEPIVEITLSLGLGALMGYLLHRTEKFFHSRSKRLSISVAYVLLAVGISLIDIQVGGIHTGFSLLLVCMMMGTVFCNVCNFSEELMERVDGWTGPISVLFFVMCAAQPPDTAVGNTQAAAARAGFPDPDRTALRPAAAPAFPYSGKIWLRQSN